MAQQEVHNGGATKGAVTDALVFTTVKLQLLVEVPKVSSAIHFYNAGFGVEELGRTMHPKHKADQELPLILSTQLKLGGSTFLVCDFVDDFATPPQRLLFVGLQEGLEGEQMHNGGGFPRAVRLDFPRFSGDNPSRWIFKANQYFEINQTNPTQKLLVASYHMDEEALIWFQDAWESGQLTSWEVFVRALLHFGSITYDDPMEALTRLKQTTIVAAYKAQFESLSNRLKGLSDHHKLSCFLSGLKDEIRLPVRMLNPINLGVAFGLAKIQEEYLIATRRSFFKTTADRGFSFSNNTSNMAGQLSDSGSYAWEFLHFSKR